MKQLIVPLVVLLMGCGTFSNNGTNVNQNTLEIFNSSGGVVRIFANDGLRYSLGRAYPGRTCLKLRVVSSNNIAFGFQHLADDEVWMPTMLPSGLGVGWSIVINTPSMAHYDILGVLPAERCE